MGGQADSRMEGGDCESGDHAPMQRCVGMKKGCSWGGAACHTLRLHLNPEERRLGQNSGTLHSTQHKGTCGMSTLWYKEGPSSNNTLGPMGCIAQGDRALWKDSSHQSQRATFQRLHALQTPCPEDHRAGPLMETGESLEQTAVCLCCPSSWSDSMLTQAGSLLIAVVDPGCGHFYRKGVFFLPIQS